MTAWAATGLAPAAILWLLTILGVVAACTDWGKP